MFHLSPSSKWQYPPLRGMSPHCPPPLFISSGLLEPSIQNYFSTVPGELRYTASASHGCHTGYRNDVSLPFLNFDGQPHHAARIRGVTPSAVCLGGIQNIVGKPDATTTNRRAVTIQKRRRTSCGRIHTSTCEHQRSLHFCCLPRSPTIHYAKNQTLWMQTDEW